MTDDDCDEDDCEECGEDTYGLDYLCGPCRFKEDLRLQAEAEQPSDGKYLDWLAATFVGPVEHQ